MHIVTSNQDICIDLVIHLETFEMKFLTLNRKQ